MNKMVKASIAFGFCGASLWFLWYVSSPLRNIQAAQRHIPVVERALARYPEFRDVHPSIGTTHGGVFVVMGLVANTKQLARLKNIVMATHPPVKTLFTVHVSNPQIRPIAAGKPLILSSLAHGLSE